MAQELPDQADALLSMTVDWGAMKPVRATVREALSTPYEIEVTAVHEAEDAIAPRDILQNSACVTIQHAGALRRFHGLVRGYQPLGRMRGFLACTLTIVPRLWALGQAEDCRIFHDLKAEEIIREVLAGIGLQDVRFRISGATPALRSCTQFNETGLAFVTRLMEEHGWYYFFEQSEREETVVVTDNNAGLFSLGPIAGHGVFDGMRAAHGVARGTEQTLDYNAETPTTEIKGEQATLLRTVGPLSPVSFAWPAYSGNPDQAARRARLRMEASETAAALFVGESIWPLLSPGHVFDLLDDTFTTGFGLDPGQYAIRSATHQAVDEAWLVGGAPASYANGFEAFPYRTTWRQPMATARPRIEGVHAAIVIGGENEVVHTDELGRVKIRFFWDHRGDASADAEVWARVVQPWAGPGWGGQFIPRIGTEVAVAFMNGDPDRPVVIGGLYNGADAPIYDKASNTKSGFRTRSFAKASGGAAEFSEFTFDDKQGEERVYLHAQKDLGVAVENDLDLKVDNCRIVRVVKDDTLGVDGKQDWTVKGDQSLKVTEGSRSVVVSKGDQKTELGQGDYSLALKKGDMATAIDMGHYKLDTKMGDVTVKAAAGQVTIEAMKTITLKVGANSVVIDQMGVKINGLTLKLKGETMTSVESGLMTSIKGTMTEVKGEGMLVLKGAITMIN